MPRSTKVRLASILLFGAASALALPACVVSRNASGAALQPGQEATIAGRVVAIDTDPWAYDGNAVIQVATELPLADAHAEEVHRADADSHAHPLLLVLHQAVDDPTSFYLYENWTSAEALDAHFQTPHLQHFVSVKDDLLDDSGLILNKLKRIA